VIATAAVGMTFIIVSAGIDLSAGSLVALSGVYATMTIASTGSLSAGLLVGLITGITCGAINGFTITKGKLPPFIVTLGMLEILRGTALQSTGGLPISKNIPESFNNISNAVFKIPVGGNVGIALNILLAICILIFIITALVGFKNKIHILSFNIRKIICLVLGLIITTLVVAKFDWISSVLVSSLFKTTVEWPLAKTLFSFALDALYFLLVAGIAVLAVFLIFEFCYGFKLDPIKPRFKWTLIYTGFLSTAIILIDLFNFNSRGDELIIPYSVFILIPVAVIGGFILKYTVFGVQVYAVGSNEQTARLCGVNVDRVKIFVYMFGGLTVALAGILQASRLRTGQPATGLGLELDIIAAVVVGGGSLMGGEGTILGSVVGAFIIRILRNGCVLMDISPFVQRIIIGLIIIAAVFVDQLRRRSMENSKNG